MFKYNNLYLYSLLVVQLYKHIDTDTHSLTGKVQCDYMWMYNDYLVYYIIKEYKTLYLETYTFIDSLWYNYTNT